MHQRLECKYLDFGQAQNQEQITKTVSLKYCLKEQTAENTKIGI